MTPYKNLQEVFDKAAPHLLTQMSQAMRPSPYGDERCAYLTEDGRACAIGACLPPEVQQEVKGHDGSIYGLLNGVKPVRSVTDLFKNVSVDCLQTLQKIHDLHPPSEWLNLLRSYAMRNKLDPSVLAQFD